MDLVRLTDSVAHLRLPVGHVYLCLDDNGVTLVDTGAPGSAPAIAEALTRLGRRTDEVRRVVLTHGHVDHTGSTAEVAGWGRVEVCAHHADAPYVEGAPPPPPDLLDWERPLFERYGIGALPAPATVDRRLTDGDALDVGGGAVVVGAPGHTPGSIGLHLTGPNVLFCGDTVARGPDGAVMLGVFNVDRAAAAASFRRFAALRPAIACFGHGDPLTDDTAAVLATAAGR